MINNNKTKSAQCIRCIKISVVAWLFDEERRLFKKKLIIK